MCQEKWLPYLWVLMWLFYKASKQFRWMLVRTHFHQWLSLVWRCQSSLFSFLRGSLLGGTCHSKRPHNKHALLTQTQHGWNPKLRVLSFQYFKCAVPARCSMGVFILSSRSSSIVNTCLLYRVLRKDMFRALLHFWQERFSMIVLLLHTQVLKGNKVESPCFLTAKASFSQWTRQFCQSA